MAVFNVWSIVALLAASYCATSQAEGPVAAPEISKSAATSADGNGSPADLSTLVRQLGDDLFAVRENATAQLIQTGIKAKPQLVAVLDSSDAEVRRRAKQILAAVVDEDFQRRLNAFRADVDGSKQTSLPCWNLFKQTIGSDAQARQLFSEMQTTESALLEAYEQGPKQASKLIESRAQAAAEGIGSSARRGQRPQAATLGTALAILFVAGDPKVELNDPTAANIVQLPSILQSSNVPIVVQQSLTAKPPRTEANARTEMCLKVLGRWVARDISLALVQKNLECADAYRLKEGLQPAIKVIQARATLPPGTVRGPLVPAPAGVQFRAVQQMIPAPPEVLCRAVWVVGKLGNKEQLPLIEPLLSDAQVCFSTPSGAQPLEAQMRDVALAATIQISGKDPKEFGFEFLSQAANVQYNGNRFAFRSEEARNAAFKKWEDWKNSQKQAVGDEKKPASS
ncbi:MAG TPA: hypothetical protein VGJ15_04430 [Pirellulales bacterium]